MMSLVDEICRLDIKAFLETEGHVFQGKKTLCCFHQDKNPSLDVEVKNGIGVWYCHACKEGGNIITYVAKRYNISKSQAINKLADRFNLKKPRNKSKVVAEYPYHDEQGKELFRVVRFEPKDFRCKHKVNNSWKWDKKGLRQVLYNFPEIIKHESLWLVEGEKDCETLRKLGIPATTSPFGVAHWRLDFAKQLKGKKVNICLDKGCDDESRRRAKDILKYAEEVRIIDLPDLDKDGQDISDWVKMQDNLELKAIRQKLIDIALNAPKFEVLGNNIHINNEFLKNYCESISRSTDAPYIFILFSGIALLSGILSKFYFHYPLETHLNLYILLLAPSTFYRKTICLDIASDYMKQVNEEMCFPESFTPEALFSILSDQNRGIIFWREFNQVKEFQFGKDYNRGLSELLTDVYDFKRIWKRKIKAEDLIVLKEPILSILAAGVTSWFTEKLRDIDFQGGLWTRFLFIPADEEKRTYHWPSKLISDLSVLADLKRLDTLDPGEIDFSKVKDGIIEWGKKHMEEAQKLDSEIFRATFLRLEVTLLKLAAILQLSQNRSLIITSEMFKEAVKIIEFLKYKLGAFFNEEIHFGHEEKNRAKVVKYLAKKKDIPYRNLLQGVRVNASDLKKVLVQLNGEGRISWSKTQVKWLG